MGTSPLEITTLSITPGVSLGSVRLGITYGELKALLGEPDREIGFRRTFNLSYLSLHLEVLLTTREDHVVTDDSLVVSVSTLSGALIDGAVKIGDPR